jgi:hypothetical protein
MTGNMLGNLVDESGPSLDGRWPADARNPVRIIRNSAVLTQLAGPWIELTNGDVLPGTIGEHKPASSEIGLPAHFVVVSTTAAGWDDVAGTGVLVRETAVRRILPSPRSGADYIPGRTVLRDGKQLVARGVRFAGSEVQCLTGDGVTTVNLADIVEMHVPQRDHPRDVLADGVWSTSTDKNSILRVRTRDGWQVTFDRQLARVSEHRWLTVRPNWSLDTLKITLHRLASISFRDRDEVPLSCLPATVVRTKSLVQHLPWRRNANVRGSELRAAGMAADLGIGTHSYSEIAFDLPPGALRFSAAVGIDDRVGKGGCVQCRVHRDEPAAAGAVANGAAGTSVTGPTLWKSGFLVGAGPLAQIGPLDVAGAARLALVTDFGDEGRPTAADPLDIRDHVDWLTPMVTVSPDQLPQPTDDVGRWIGALAGWQVTPEVKARLSIRPAWDQDHQRFELAMAAQPDAQGNVPSIEFTRQVPLSLKNARMVVAALQDGTGQNRPRIGVKIDDRVVDSTINGDVNTADSNWHKFDQREYNLGNQIGREAKLSVVVRPQGDAKLAPAGVVWRRVALSPLVEDLPSGGKPLVPDVPITSLTPLETRLRGQNKPWKIQAGKLIDGRPLTIRGVPFASGFGAPSESDFTYKLDADWKRFVAVLGLADGWQSAGPYQILLDGKPHWQNPASEGYGRNSPGRQIDLLIPPGHKTITLRMLGRECFGAWAAAGFMK